MRNSPSARLGSSGLRRPAPQPTPLRTLHHGTEKGLQMGRSEVTRLSQQSRPKPMSSLPVGRGLQG